VTTFAGAGNAPGTERPVSFRDNVDDPLLATFYDSRSLTCDPDGNVYVADCGFNRIRKIAVPSPADPPNVRGRVTTVAGNGRYGGRDGLAAESVFSFGCGLCVDNDFTVYIADMNNHCVRKLSQSIPLEHFASYLWRVLRPDMGFTPIIIASITSFALRKIERKRKADSEAPARDGHDDSGDDIGV
jgi:hypothetical protein